jgi:hypothetical protein
VVALLGGMRPNQAICNTGLEDVCGSESIRSRS